MTREEMFTLVIQKFGFEARETIKFAQAMDQLDLLELETLLKEILAIDIITDNEEDEL